MDHFSKVHTSQPSCNNPFPFLFSESHISLPQIQAHNPSFFQSGIRIKFFYLTNPTPTLVLSPVIMHFTISFPI